jgi:hypothetical protein
VVGVGVRGTIPIACSLLVIRYMATIILVFTYFPIIWQLSTYKWYNKTSLVGWPLLYLIHGFTPARRSVVELLFPLENLLGTGNKLIRSRPPGPSQ